jgi:hypothetical protein
VDVTAPAEQIRININDEQLFDELRTIPFGGHYFHIIFAAVANSRAQVLIF